MWLITISVNHYTCLCQGTEGNMDFGRKINVMLKCTGSTSDTDKKVVWK